jgi:hypothetical protein
MPNSQKKAEQCKRSAFFISQICQSQKARLILMNNFLENRTSKNEHQTSNRHNDKK